MSLNSQGDPCVWGACFLVTAKSNKYPDYDPRTFPSVLSQKGDQTKRKYRDTKALSVNEEILVQELNELHAEPVFRPQNGTHDDEDGLNFDGDWPPPPQAEPEEPKISPAKSDSEIYTSFLTIDVSGKSEGLGFFGKHRAASLLSLLTASNESLVTAGIDAENEEQAKDDLGMISKYLSNMVLTRSQWSHNYDVLRDLVKLYIGAKTNSTRFLCNLLDYFLKLNWPGTFLNCMRKILKEYPQVFVHSSDRKIPFEDPTPETLDVNRYGVEYAAAVVFQVFLSLAADFTEMHTASREACCRGRFLRFIFQDLFPKLHAVSWGKNTAREEFLHSAMDIVYNCSHHARSISCFYECNAVEVLTKFAKETEYIGGNRVNIAAILTLASVIDDRNNHLIIPDSASLSPFVRHIDESLSKIDHLYADFKTSELIDGLTRIATHERNKLLLCGQTTINTMVKVLKKATDDEERLAVCRFFWTLCFVEKCKQTILRRVPEVVNLIRELKKSKSHTLRRTADCLIWELEEKYEQRGPNVTDPDIPHVMLSFHADQQSVMLQIRDELKRKGYEVSMDERRTEKFPSKTAADAVEKSAAVLIAVSRKYKESPDCFAEADYAFHLRKHMIPLVMERNYKPDGWLGMLVGSKVWLDFSEDSKFTGNMHLLLRQLGDKGKTERAINILYVGDPPKDKVTTENSTPNDGSHNRLTDISKWNNEDVVQWMLKNNLKACVAEDKLRKLRGAHLIRLHHLRKESPDFYYSSLEPQLGFSDVLDMLEFTQALERLTEGSI